MAEDQEKIKPSGLAPGPEVPYEKRFLSTEKQYPTKEAREKALEVARGRVRPKLPSVPPFTMPQPREEAWAEKILAQSRAERLSRSLQEARKRSPQPQEPQRQTTKVPVNETFLGKLKKGFYNALRILSS